MLCKPPMDEREHLPFMPYRTVDVAQRKSEIDYLILIHFADNLLSVLTQLGDLNLCHGSPSLSGRKSRQKLCPEGHHCAKARHRDDGNRNQNQKGTMQYLLRLYQTAIPQTSLCSDRSNAASFALSGRIVSLPVPWRTSSPLLQNLVFGTNR